MGIVKFLSVRIFEIIIFVLLIVFMPSIPPNANFTSFKVASPRSLEGKLALNNRLSAAEKLYENDLKGPEAFADYKGELYTSLFTGEVVKFSKGHIVPVVQFGQACEGYAEESICGRPLGLKFDKNGNMYVADAYMGIWKVDIKTGKKTLLVSMDQEIEGKKSMIPNSIALSENEDIYWTDSSTEFKLEDGVYTLLADGTGRVVHYDSKTKTNKVLFDGLQFANGIILSDDGEFLLVAETAQSRIHRYYLKGPKKGTRDIFIDGLPGMPDNLNSDGQGGFLSPLITARDADHPAISQVFGPLPLVRKLIARILGLIELSFRTVHRLYPNIYTQHVIHWVGHFESMSALLPRRVTILRLSKSGEILDSWHSTDNSISAISEAYIFGDHLYLGSPFNTYVARVPLSTVDLTSPSKTQAKRDAPPPTRAPMKETPKPKPAPTRAPTTTPKPPPTKQVPTTAPTTQQPPTQAPVKQTAPPVKQAPPTPAPTAKPTTAAPKTTTAPPKRTPPPTVQTKPTAPQTATKAKAPEAATTTKQNTAPTNQDRTKQAADQAANNQPEADKPTAQQTQSPPKAKDTDKEAPKVVPVKENAVPKSESIKSRN